MDPNYHTTFESHHDIQCTEFIIKSAHNSLEHQIIAAYAWSDVWREGRFLRGDQSEQVDQSGLVIALHVDLMIIIITI